MLSNTHIVPVTALLLSALSPTWAQPAVDPALAGFRLSRVTSPTFDISSLVDVLGAPQAFVQYLRAKPAHVAFTRNVAFKATFVPALKAVENGRVDEQAGGSATLGGAASAAEKAGLTGLITAALETGAMTQTLDQNILTVRGNAEGLFHFLTGQEVLPICETPTATSCDASPWNNLEVTASFDVSKTSTTEQVEGTVPSTGAQLTALLTSSKRQFASASARYAIINSRDLHSAKYREAWLKWFAANQAGLGVAGNELLVAVNDIKKAVQNTQAKDANGNLRTVNIPRPDGSIVVLPVMIYDDWLTATKAALAGATHSEAAVAAILQVRLEILETDIRELVPDFDAKLEIAANAYTRFFNLTRQGFALGNMPMLTASLTYSEPTLQPKVIDGKFSFAWSPKSNGPVNPGTLTVNGGLSFYTKPQHKDTKGGTARFRTADFAFQFDRPVDANGAVALTLGGYFQYQNAPSLIFIPPGTTAPGGVPLPGNAVELLAPKGTIAVAHASITLQIPGSGVKVPIGISWSNRTQLVTGNEIRGHIGFNFDTHSILLQK
ncbi:MAG: hypothetical protein ABI759_08135 [Candidatus Solibacter sp.]